MTTDPNTSHADRARTAIRAVLSGAAPNGTRPEDCGPYAEVVAGLFAGYAASGTAGVRTVWASHSKADPRLIKLVSTEPTEAERAWGGVLPFYQIDLPSFPLVVFPTWIQDFCAAVTEAMQTPPDLAGMLALSVLSTACARRVGVRAWNGWEEPVCLFTVTSLGPGNRKSVVFRAMMGPLLKFEQELAEKAEAEIFQAQARQDILKQQIEEAKRKTAKIQGEHAIRQAFSEIEDMGRALQELVVPARPKLIVDDVTPETIASILADQGGRLAVLSPEGDIFGIMAGRYTSGPPNLGVYLKAHAGDTIRVDRRTRSEHVRQPALTMGITTQPEVMRSFGSNSAFRGQGLLARFLYAIPKSTVGTRVSESEPIPDHVKATYFHRMLLLLEQMHSVHSVHSVQSDQSVHSGTPTDHQDSTNILYIEISIEAKNRLVRFMDWLEPQIGPYGTLEHVADWAAKLAGAVLRIAGLLHMADTLGQNGQNGQNTISDNVMARAISLAHYLLPHAQAAYAEIGASPSIEAAKYILRWIEKNGAHIFKQRDCYRGVRGHLFKSADDCDEPLRLLADHGYIREIDQEDRAGKTGRKPSATYEVNPIVFGHNGQNGQNAREAGASYTYTDIETAAYEPPTFRAVEGY